MALFPWDEYSAGIGSDVDFDSVNAVERVLGACSHGCELISHVTGRELLDVCWTVITAESFASYEKRFITRKCCYFSSCEGGKWAGRRARWSCPGSTDRVKCGSGGSRCYFVCNKDGR